MKREFLQEMKVGDMSLPKQIVDAIMAENGRDIEAAKRAFGDYDTLKSQLEEAQVTIREFREQDIEGVRQAAKDWEEKYHAAVEQHRQDLAERDFRQALEGSIIAARGRNAKAIEALLDMEALRGSKDPQGDIAAALEGLRKECGYLFDDGQVPPPYAGGTGSFGGQGPKGESLAGALRERYRK